MTPRVLNPGAVGDPAQTPVVRLGDGAAEVLGVRERLAPSYQCLIGGDECPGHRSKWLVCTPTESNPLARCAHCGGPTGGPLDDCERAECVAADMDLDKAFERGQE